MNIFEKPSKHGSWGMYSPIKFQIITSQTYLMTMNPWSLEFFQDPYQELYLVESAYGFV